MHNNVPDLISANGCWLRNQDTTYFKATISGKQTLEVSRNWSYGKHKLHIPNSKYLTIASTTKNRKIN